jgi:type VI secretion system protein ImpA
LTEALGHLHGFAGVRDGLRLMNELQDRFWDSYYPQLEDGDVETRWGPFEFLNNERLLPLIIRSVPVTSVSGEKRYSQLRWQESRATDNAGKKSSDMLDSLVAEGKITGEQFDEAVAQTPRAFYEVQVADLADAAESFKALDASCDAHFGRDAPGIGNIRKAIEDVRRLLDPILARKRAQEPDLETDAEPEAEVDDATSDDPEPSDEGTRPTAPTARRPASAARRASGPIGDADDARSRVREAAAYLRENDPESPVSYLVTRALRMGELYSPALSPGSACLPSPTSETRQLLKRLAADGEWLELLDRAEQSLASACGRAWLDPHRYALAAIASLGDSDRSAPARACQSWLRMILADFPELAAAELNDDTAAANAETRSWLTAEVAPPTSPEPPTQIETEPVHSSITASHDAHSGENGEPDPWDLAVAEARSGRANEAIQRIRRAIASSTTGREKFLRKLQLAELCLMVGSHRVALPLLEDLGRLVDEFRLEQWEDESLCARVWGALYRCLKSQGPAASTERLDQVYTRLCRLDIGQALSHGAQ